MTDLTYSNQGLFTLFIPESPAGISAWQAMSQDTQGTGKVLTMHAKAVIMQLRKAGYKVSKAKPVDMTMDDIMKELEA